MKNQLAVYAAALLLVSACQNSGDGAPAIEEQNEVEIADCIRTIMKLDEGRWAYMGTIARGNGKFRTYATTSVHAAAGPDRPDTWSNQSFGGDVGGEEETAEISYSQLVGTSIVPIENGTLMEDNAVKYTSCVGPDAEGRYEAKLEYTLPHGDGSKLAVNNVSWYSEHGSYYAEDIFYKDGRVLARRSGVNTPAEE